VSIIVLMLSYAESSKVKIDVSLLIECLLEEGNKVTFSSLEVALKAYVSAFITRGYYLIERVLESGKPEYKYANYTAREISNLPR